MKIYEISKSPLFEISKAEKKRLQAIANQQKFDATQQERDAENKLKSDKLAQITQMRADVQAQAIADRQAEEKRKAELRAEREAEEKRKEEYEATVGKEKYMQINFSPKEYKEYSEPLEYFDSYDTSLVQEALQDLYNKHGKIEYIGYYPDSRISLVIEGKLQIRTRRTNKVKHEIGIWSDDYCKAAMPEFYPKTIKEAAKLIGLLYLNDVNKLINHKILSEDDIHYEGKAHEWEFFPLDGDHDFTENLERAVRNLPWAPGKSPYDMMYYGKFRKDAMWEVFSPLFPNSSFYLTQTKRSWSYGTHNSVIIKFQDRKVYEFPGDHEPWQFKLLKNF